MHERGVVFRWKDYRAEGATRHKTMSLAPEEFVRRFLLHVLPGGLHCIRHYGLLAICSHKSNLALARELLPDSNIKRCHEVRNLRREWTATDDADPSSAVAARRPAVRYAAYPVVRYRAPSLR